MKQDYWTYNKPLSVTGLGGGATSLSFASAAGAVNPFDDMSNFTGATKISGTDIIYYSSSGSYTFVDPNNGLSKFRFTVVGGGGASDGDNYGWFANTGGGGGGGVRAEIQSAETLTIGVGQGGGSAGFFTSGLTARDASWFNASITNSSNGINRVKGRGGESFVKKSTDYVLKATGGNTGVTRYHFLSGYDNHITYINAASSSGYSHLGLNGNRGYFYNGGYGYSYTVSGVTTSNATYHYGGIGGCAAHNSSHSGVSSSHIHPLDNGAGVATNGENTTYSGAGGGGGGDSSGETPSGSTGVPNGGTGGTASGLATLLSGSGITAAGGNGSNRVNLYTIYTAGAAGGGHGGASYYLNYSGGVYTQWGDSFTAAEGIVIVEFLGF